MCKIIKILAMVSLVSALGFAESISGKLIDAACYSQQKKNIEDGSTAARKSCAPTASTITFAIEAADGNVYNLDSAGSAKATALYESNKSGKAEIQVTATGSMDGHDLKVESLETK